MAIGSKYALRRSVQRSLAIRLLIGGLTISFAFGLAILLIERNKLSESVVSHIIRGAEAFSEQNREFLDEEGLKDTMAIQTKAEAFASDYKKLGIGHSVLLKIYSTDGATVGKLEDKEYKRIKSATSLMESIEIIPPSSNKGSHKIIQIEGIPHIMTVTPLIDSNGNLIGFIVSLFAPSDETVYAMRFKAVKTMLAAIAVVLLTTLLLYPLIRKLTDKLSDFSVKLLDSNLDTLEIIGSAIALRDSDTNEHNYRVTIFSVRIAEAAGLPIGTIQTLIKGAFLHDVGKIGIVDNILLKPGRLDEKEFSIMKTHVNLGVVVMKRSEWLKDAIEVVGSHHKKMDGSGYGIGKGIAGEEIPVTARVFAIADVFDALTSKRPYKDPFSFEKTMNIMKEMRESHFDPHFLDVFTGIAEGLYKRLSAKDEMAREELAKIVDIYFRREKSGPF
jgi:HD-GYP domain-containing protein (c-di-GMP phosphodiesterase class II)